MLLNRRDMLQVGAVSALGLSLPQLLRADSMAGPKSADSCILLFLNGGPSHLDMWDMKPDAPAEIRGEFKPIASFGSRNATQRTFTTISPADAPRYHHPLGSSQRQ
jgi:uncharacterized protein (DUF1501 family)